MIENINDRIKFIYEQSGKTQVRFAQALGVDPSYISHLLSGKHAKKPSALFLNLVSELYSVNLDWLKTGEGEPFIQKVSETLAPYGSVVPIEDIPREQMLEFIITFWSKATPDEKAWFKIQFRKSFPEFEAWLNKKESGAAAAG